MTTILLPLALAANGLAAGGLMIAMLGGAPLQMRLEYPDYVRVHQFLTTRFDPFMPICLLAGLAVDVLLVVLGEVSVPALPALAGACLLATFLVSLTRNLPINRWVASLSPDVEPSGWPANDPRSRWRVWNTTRTTTCLAGLVLNALAVGAQL